MANLNDRSSGMKCFINFLSSHSDYCTKSPSNTTHSVSHQEVDAAFKETLQSSCVQIVELSDDEEQSDISILKNPASDVIECYDVDDDDDEVPSQDVKNDPVDLPADQSLPSEVVQNKTRTEESRHPCVMIYDNSIVLDSITNTKSKDDFLNSNPESRDVYVLDDTIKNTEDDEIIEVPYIPDDDIQTISVDLRIRRKQSSYFQDASHLTYSSNLHHTNYWEPDKNIYPFPSNPKHLKPSFNSTSNGEDYDYCNVCDCLHTKNSLHQSTSLHMSNLDAQQNGRYFSSNQDPRSCHIPLPDKIGHCNGSSDKRISRKSNKQCELACNSSSQKTDTSFISSDNIGFKLLVKAGWEQNTGLGKHRNGIVNPIETVVKRNRLGLGMSNPRVRSKPSFHP